MALNNAQHNFNIVFCRPPYDAYIITPLLGLGYLNAYMKKEGYNAHIVDPLQKSRLSMAGTVKKISSFNPDLVGIHATTDFIPEAKNLVRMLRKVIPRAKICLGGPHSTSIPEETLSELGVDFIIVGEGEETVLELVKKLEKGETDFKRVKGICFKDKKGKTILTEKRELIKNLDYLPFPDWEEINPNFYPPAPHGIYTKSHPVGPIMSSRGCPYFCTFCASNAIWRHKFRQRSAKNIVDEIELLVKKYGCKEIHFEDDNFTLLKEKTIEVCNEIIRRKLKIDWKCPNGVRIDKLDDELLAKMKASGCYLLALGIESGNQDILNRAKKNLDLSIVKEKIAMIKKHGIITHGFFMIGFPGDTKKTVMQTIKFAGNSGLHTAQFNILCPFPGSEVYDEWIKTNSAIKEWSRFTVHTGMYETGDLSAKDLKNLQRLALIYYYLNPINFFNFVRHIRSNQLKFMFNIIKNFILPEGKK
ncbi:MAG: radical SAM protein [Candidatus Doudnabacteria bacterium]